MYHIWNTFSFTLDLSQSQVERERVFLNHRKFLKQSEIVYNGLEIKNDMAKERMVDSP